MPALQSWGALEKPLPRLEGKVLLELEPAWAPGLLGDPQHMREGSRQGMGKG